MMLIKSERQKIIIDLKAEIKTKLDIDTRIEKAKTGRDGTLLYASINKKGVRGLEVISMKNGDILMGVSVNNDAASDLVKDVMKEGRYSIEKDQTNPRYTFSVEIFGKAYAYLMKHPKLND